MQKVDHKYLLLVIPLLLIQPSNPIALKYAMFLEWPPYLLGALRMSMISCCFMIWVLFAKQSLLGTWETRRWILPAAFCKALGIYCFFTALSLISASRVIMLGASAPILNLLLVRILLKQEKVRYHHVIGLTISLCGVLFLLTLRSVQDLSFESIHIETGDLILLLGLLLTGCMTICEKHAVNHGALPQQLVASINLFSVPLFITLTLFAEPAQQNFPTSFESWAIFIYLFLIGSVLFYYRRWMLIRVPVTFLNSLTYLERAIGIAYAMIFLGETVSFMSLIGFGMILAGSAFAIQSDLHQKAPNLPASLSQS